MSGASDSGNFVGFSTDKDRSKKRKYYKTELRSHPWILLHEMRAEIAFGQ